MIKFLVDNPLLLLFVIAALSYPLNSFLEVMLIL
jgi:hypothetical protein